MRDPWITEPGHYPDVTPEEYHADPVVGGSLSSSGARKLLPPSCPAKYHHELGHPPEPKAHFDFGHAAHRLVLGVGAEIVEVKADNWRTKKANQDAAKARDAGKTPLLTKDYAKVHDMAEVLREHPIAAALLDPTAGAAEQCIVWRDEPTGVMCRAMIDWLRLPPPGQRMIAPDYKTANTGDPETWGRLAWDHGYYHQASFYTDGIMAALGVGQVAFVFIVQEKDPPHLVTCFQPEDFGVRLGRYLNADALEVYARCKATGEWPGYADSVVEARLPQYIVNRYREAIE